MIKQIYVPNDLKLWFMVDVQSKYDEPDRKLAGMTGTDRQKLFYKPITDEELEHTYQLDEDTPTIQSLIESDTDFSQPVYAVVKGYGRHYFMLRLINGEKEQHDMMYTHRFHTTVSRYDFSTLFDVDDASPLHIGDDIIMEERFFEVKSSEAVIALMNQLTTELHAHVKQLKEAGVIE